MVGVKDKISKQKSLDINIEVSISYDLICVMMKYRA